jgi:hypothetical protein
MPTLASVESVLNVCDRIVVCIPGSPSLLVYPLSG